MELSAPRFTLTHTHLLVKLTHNAKLSLGPLKTIQNSRRGSIRSRGRIRIRGAACRTNTAEKERGRNEACTHLLFDIDGGVRGNEWIVRRFSASSLQSKPPPKQKEDFYINTGYAVRALREQLPSMFYKEPTFDIYRDDIVFRDPINMFSGIDNYKLIFWALRFHGKIFFKALWIDILRIWHPAEKVIMIRWTIYGIPRVPWEAQGRFDGTSEYKLDSDGKIYEHKVDNIELSSRRNFSVPLVESLIGALGSPSTPRPTYFETIGIVFWMLLPYLIQFTWVRYYVAMKGTVDLKNATLGFNSVHV